MRFLYNFIIYLILPFAFMRLWWRGKVVPAYRKRWAERLGFFEFPVEQQGGLWIHAVSLGETIAAIPLIQALQKQYPQIPITITNMTPTGSAQVQQAFGNQVGNVYVPYDSPGAVKRFLKRVQPRIGIIIETELWPNLLRGCRRVQVPVMLANARLSARSARGYGRIGSLTRQMLADLSLIAVQNESDGERFAELGLPSEKLVITGSIKFDINPPMNLIHQGQILRQYLGTERPAWVAASTHPGEEAAILKAFMNIRKTLPTTLLIWVPRHPHRINSIVNLCQEAGHRVTRRSKTQESNQEPNQETDVFLGDTFGEMFLFYACADVAFVGGSLAPIGGHNMIEPAALGLPIITGPYLHNFSQISQVLESAGVLTQVRDETQLAAEVLDLLQDAERRKKQGEQAKKIVAENQGAIAKHLSLIQQLF